ncbi:MAG: hypothetical protein AAFY42_04615 [Pseudomonadota bacterium]
MKLLMAASGLVLATFALPQVAMAQSDAPQSTILVTAENQRDWNRGNELEAKGLRDLQEASRKLVRHSADVVTAQETRDTSRSRADNARQAFESLTARPFFSDPEDARKWAQQVESTARDWARFAERGVKADRDLKKAQGQQEKAQERVDKAQRRVDEGRAMMAAAERASMGRVSAR